MKSLVILTLLTAFLSANPTINGGGASFPANAYMAWIKSYQQATKNKINYQSIGSGGGIKQVKSGITDFGASDEPLTKEELAKSNLLQFPTLAGGIVVVYNLEGIKDNTLKLSNEVLSDIFLGIIKNWNDPKIAKDNPTLKLPNEPIIVIHRSDGSGTTYNFSLFLSKISKIWNDTIGKGKAISWPVGIGAKGNEGVTALIKQTKNSIGYVEFSYKEQAKLRAALLKNSQNQWVSANEKNISSALTHATWDKFKDFEVNLIDQKGNDTYPLVAPTFILVPKNGKNTNAVIEFFDFAFKNGGEEAKKMGLVPLPQKVQQMIRDYWKQNQLH